MTRIAIGVCTFHRPGNLPALLTCLGEQRVARADADVTIIIVDNSPDGDARATVAGIAASHPLTVRYVHEPRTGLACARNRALRAATEAGARYLAFIDDDELPQPEWLQHLLAAVSRTGAAAAIGPVAPLFAAQPPRWLPVEAFATVARPTEGFVSTGYTGNCIIDLTTIDAMGLLFDERYNATGGEDTAFFAALLAAGQRLAWAGSALVHEMVPRSRMSIPWLLRRWYRTGAVEAVLGTTAPGGSRPHLTAFGKGLVRIAGGALRIAAACVTQSWRRPDRVVASAFTLCRGAGYIAGAFGRLPQPYAMRSADVRRESSVKA